VLVDELETAHQFVSPAKYFAALQDVPLGLDLVQLGPQPAVLFGDHGVGAYEALVLAGRPWY
jgi:hypothetical protein